MYRISSFVALFVRHFHWTASFAISEVIGEGWPTWLLGAISPLSSALVSFEVGEVAVKMVHVMTTIHVITKRLPLLGKPKVPE